MKLKLEHGTNHTLRQVSIYRGNYLNGDYAQFFYDSSREELTGFKVYNKYNKLLWEIIYEYNPDKTIILQFNNNGDVIDEKEYEGFRYYDTIKHFNWVQPEGMPIFCQEKEE